MRFYFLLVLLFFFSCGNPALETKEPSPSNPAFDSLSAYPSGSSSADNDGRSSPEQPTKDSVADEGADAETQTYYIAAVAEGYDFDSLKKISGQAAKLLHSKTDMLGRIYKANKGIVEPDTSSDEMYRGEYYPRRPFDNQNFVSIEMKHWMLGSPALPDGANPDKERMIVIANMFSEKKSADSLLKILSPLFPSSKIIKAELYLGCMH